MTGLTPNGSLAGGTELDVAIVGAGFGGLGAGVRLRQQGFPDFLIFDQADDIGGTWRDNTYPGCACDVPSHLYSYSFAHNPSWSDTFSGQPEIWEYLRDCVDRFDLGDRLRLRHTVHEAVWDEARQRWRLVTSQGDYWARALISATGPLSKPAVPDIEGLGSFAGPVFHSARWRHDLDLAGRRVAVIGTGASAGGFVPEIQPVVRKLTLFQRTPAWVMPRWSRPLTRMEHGLYRRVPGAQRLARTVIYWAREALAMGLGFRHPVLGRLAQRASLHHLHRQVRDPALRAKLTPDYRLGCKRLLVSNTYWAALAKDNVDVVTEPILRVEPDGVVTGDGTRHPADTLILGTGFRATERLVGHEVRGRDGVSLTESWTPTMRAYLGTAVHGFPNLFLLLGPNTGVGYTSAVLMIEAQLRQVVKALRHLRRTGAATIEPTRAAQQRHTDRVDAMMADTVWVTGCTNWYSDATGRNSILWPGYATGFRLRASRFRPDDYLTTPRVPGRVGDLQGDRR